MAKSTKGTKGTGKAQNSTSKTKVEKPVHVKTTLSEAEKSFIREKRKELSIDKLAELCGVDKYFVHEYIVQLGKKNFATPEVSEKGTCVMTQAASHDAAEADKVNITNHAFFERYKNNIHNCNTPRGESD